VPKRILLTGISGFAGRHLAELLRRETAHDVYGLGSAATTTAPCLRYYSCNLMNATAVERVVRETWPNVVYHLAALTGNAPAERFHAVNVVGFRNLVYALRSYAQWNHMVVRLLVVGSAAELGTAGVARLPVEEQAACDPETAYGRSKLEVTRLALAEPVEGPLRVTVARTFNLVGPGMSSNLSLGRFVEQIAAYRRSEIDALRCGNLSARRDYVDVRDAAAAYVAIAERGRPGELYNVCRGRSFAIGELLSELIAASGLPVPVVAEDGSPRAGDVADIYGDPTKTERETGWLATTPMHQSLRDLLIQTTKPAAAA
jgi:GDP-4-dehydro-6-deoxy-D-mannose reductase